MSTYLININLKSRKIKFLKEGCDVKEKTI